MLRKLTHVSIIFLVSVTMLTCDKLSGPSPSEILNNYLDASLKGRFEEAYSYVSAEDKAIKDLHSYLKENDKEDNPFAQAIVSKVSYKILKLDKSEKKASADVEITLPDIGSMFADVMGAAFKSAFGGGDEKAMEKEWSWDEVLEKWGGNYEKKENWRKVYNAGSEVNKKVAIETGIKDLFIVRKKTIFVNPKYLPLPK